MNNNLKHRMERLEATHRPPAAMWTIPIDVVEWRGDDAGGFGRVVGHIPARPIEPGEPFDYRKGIEELVRAMGYDDAQL
jgi:hypothetical protein